MLWVYDHYKYLFSYTCYSAEIDFRRQILTSKVDPRAVRVNTGLWLPLCHVRGMYHSLTDYHTYMQLDTKIYKFMSHKLTD